jgi:DNA adenine methylase
LPLCSWSAVLCSHHPIHSLIPKPDPLPQRPVAQTRIGTEQRLRSFLRWVGGKRLIISRLLPLLPADMRDRRYVEPFLGAASLFFALRPKKALLSDLNEHLINCYRWIRDDPKTVASHLQRLAQANSESLYYKVRDTYNRSASSPTQAARFIYLNRTCFNGVFRVNRQGRYNVPFGDKPNPIFPSDSELTEAGKALKPARLRAKDYHEVLKNCEEGDLVYLDPPYPPINGTSFFTHYTPDRFSALEQEHLAQVFECLHHLGCKVMMTNADLPLIRQLYRGYFITEISVTRYVTCKSVKHRIGELVITNYAPPKAHP